MSMTPTHRPTREWPLLILTLALIGAIVIPCLNWTGGQEPANTYITWTPERIRRLLLGPEQVLSFICFTWAGFILLGRYGEVRRQRKAFDFGLLPTDEGVRILPEDARPLQRKIEQLTTRGPYILANMLRLALGKYAVSRSSSDVSQTVAMQAEVEQGRLVSSMATVHYLAWAIPALGFVGTVRGLGAGLGMSAHIDAELQTFIEQTTGHLATAFDTTFVALILSLVLMFVVHTVQRDEEQVVLDSQGYCLEHLVNRLYDPESLPVASAHVPEPRSEPARPRPATITRIPS